MEGRVVYYDGNISFIMEVVMSDPQFKFQNGDKVKDITTGLVGVVAGRHDYPCCENRYGVTYLANGEKKTSTFDETQMELQAK